MDQHSKVTIVHEECAHSKGIIISFLNIGAQNDLSVGIVGLSHMLEHIMIGYKPNLFINGSTTNNAINFAVIDQDNTYSDQDIIDTVTSYLTSPNLSEERIRCCIKELNNETYLKTLSHGPSIDLVASICKEEAVQFSQFATDLSVDMIAAGLDKMYRYMMTNAHKVITHIGMKKTMVWPKLNIKPVQLESTLLNLDEEMYNLIDPYAKRNETYMFLPITVNSNIRTICDAMSNRFGVASFYDTCISNKGRYLILHVDHDNAEYQNKYISCNLHMLNHGHHNKSIFDANHFFLYGLNYLFGEEPVGHPLVVVGNPTQTEQFSFESFGTIKTVNNIRFNMGYNYKSLSSPSQQSILKELLCHNRCIHFGSKKKVQMTKTNMESKYLVKNYSSMLAAAIWNTLSNTIVEYNNIYCPKFLPMHYMTIPTKTIIDSSQLPFFIMQLRINSIMDKDIDFDTALAELRSREYVRLVTSNDPIGYVQTIPQYTNNILYYYDPFKHFVHVVHRDYLGRDMNFDRLIFDYKNRGYIYWGSYRYYEPYHIVYGISI